MKDGKDNPRLLIRKARTPEQILWPFSEKGLAENRNDVKTHILKDGVIRYCTSNKRFFCNDFEITEFITERVSKLKGNTPQWVHNYQWVPITLGFMGWTPSKCIFIKVKQKESEGWIVHKVYNAVVVGPKLEYSTYSFVKVFQSNQAKLIGFKLLCKDPTVPKLNVLRMTLKQLAVIAFNSVVYLLWDLSSNKEVRSKFINYSPIDYPIMYDELSKSFYVKQEDK